MQPPTHSLTLRAERAFKYLSKALHTKCAKGNRGWEVYFNCPFCNDHEYKYSFNIERGEGHCWRAGCGAAHYSLLQLVVHLNNCTYGEAYRLIAGDSVISTKRIKVLIKQLADMDERAEEVDEDLIINVPIPEPNLPLFDVAVPSSAKKWFTRTRGYSKEVAELFDVQYSFSRERSSYFGKVIFPVTVGYHKSWLLYSIKKNAPRKTLNPDGPINSNLLFPYRVSKVRAAKCGYVIVVEGVFDALRLVTYGYPAVCAFGAHVSDNQANLLIDMATEIVLCFDPDTFERQDRLGTTATFKAAKLLAENGASKISYVIVPRKDPDETPKALFNEAFASRISISELGSIRGRLRRMLV